MAKNHAITYVLLQQHGYGTIFDTSYLMKLAPTSSLPHRWIGMNVRTESPTSDLSAW